MIGMAKVASWRGFAIAGGVWRSSRDAGEWPDGAVLHESGDLVYVPRPPDARGRRNAEPPVVIAEAL
jgi:hypothetical protein